MCEPLRVTLKYIVLGALLAPVFTFTPLLKFMGWFLGALVHETGHTAMAWLAGCPAFPAIRVVDDFLIEEKCRIDCVQANLIEDDGWTPGNSITVTVQVDARGAKDARGLRESAGQIARKVNDPDSLG